MRRIMLMTSPDSADTIGSIPGSAEKVKRHVLTQNGINTGNKVFITATEQYLTKPDIVYTAQPYQTTAPETVAGQFDMVVAALANIFSVHSGAFLDDYSGWIRKVKCPVFILGCGIECEEEKDMQVLCKQIGPAVCRLIDAVYSGGGAIATRGFHTKAFLDLCMSNDAVATGCPSFYRNGDHVFQKNTVSYKDFSVALTSSDYPQKLLRTVLKNHPNSRLFDQGNYIGSYYRITKGEGIGFEAFLSEIRYQLGDSYVEAFLGGNVYPATEMPLWLENMKQHSLAFGSRIHGMNAALEACIPGMMVCKSLRTLEMAEYIGMPHMRVCPEDIDLFELYQSLDLSELNRKYREGLRVFEAFLSSHNISYDISDDAYWLEQQKKQVFQELEIWTETELNSMKRIYRGSGFRSSYNLFLVRKKMNQVLTRFHLSGG